MLTDPPITLIVGCQPPRSDADTVVSLDYLEDWRCVIVPNRVHSGARRVEVNLQSLVYERDMTLIEVALHALYPVGILNAF
jgi:hypothetical protein